MERLWWLLSWVAYIIRRYPIGLLSRTRLAILLDYENTSKEVAVDGKTIDFEALRKVCIKIGCVEFPFLFVPEHLVRVHGLPRYIYNCGFYPIPCLDSENGKEKDKVDTSMTELGIRLLEHSDVNTIAVISRDGDFIRLSNYARFLGKRVIVFAGKKISFLLKEAADEIFPVPVKDKEK